MIAGEGGSEAVPPTVTGPCTLEVHTDAEVFERLAVGWDRLLVVAPDASVFLSRSWVVTWWRHFGSGPWARACHSKLHVIVVRRGDQLVALLPMLSVRVGAGPASFRMMVGIGQENADYGGALVAEGDDEAMAVLLDHLASELGRRRTIIDLTRLPDSTWFHRALRARFTEPDYAFRAEDPVDYPILDLSDAAEPSLDVHRLLRHNDVLRRERRLSEKSDVEFTFHHAGRAADDLPEFLRLHDLRWHGRTPSGLFTSGWGREFLADLSESLDREGLLRISFVSADGVPFVGRFGTVFQGSYQGMKSGWDPAFAAYGPGHMLVGRILESLLEDGIQRFDFMRGPGAHKTSWSNRSRSIAYWTLGRSDRLRDVDHHALWLLLRARYRARAAPEVN